MDVTLRSACPGDEDFLYRVYASTRSAEMALVDWDDERKTAFLRMQFLAQDRHYREGFREARFDVIECDGRPIGRFYVDRGPDEIRILDIALLAEYRQRGIGSCLMDAILAEARRDGKAVSLHVERSNPASRLYERLGFVTVDEGPIYRLLELRGGNSGEERLVVEPLPAGADGNQEDR